MRLQYRKKMKGCTTREKTVNLTKSLESSKREPSVILKHESLLWLTVMIPLLRRNGNQQARGIIFTRFSRSPPQGAGAEIRIYWHMLKAYSIVDRVGKKTDEDKSGKAGEKLQEGTKILAKQERNTDKKDKKRVNSTKYSMPWVLLSCSPFFCLNASAEWSVVWINHRELLHLRGNLSTSVALRSKCSVLWCMWKIGLFQLIAQEYFIVTTDRYAFQSSFPSSTPRHNFISSSSQLWEDKHIFSW